jgi:hypothetical protein
MNRRCERSEAIQSAALLDCFALLATTNDANFQHDALGATNRIFAAEIGANMPFVRPFS